RVPVINGLSDLHHPCQVLSDCFTLLERRGRLAGLRVAFVGDGNNVVHSWMDAAVRLGFGFVLACPPGYEPDPSIIAEARPHATITHDVEIAARGADVLYTDVWTSMGQDAAAKARRLALAHQREPAIALSHPEAHRRGVGTELRLGLDHRHGRPEVGDPGRHEHARAATRSDQEPALRAPHLGVRPGHDDAAQTHTA